MTLLSSKCLYGLAALFELALAEGAPCKQIGDVARAQRIPEAYLRQLLVLLKRAGLVESARGASGGYCLARPASEIRVLDIIERLEGRLTLSRKKPRDHALATYFLDRQREIAQVFGQTLADLVAEKRKLEENIVYNI